MLTSIFVLILFLPAAFLPATIKTFFTPGELDEMGIYLEDPQIMQGCDDTAHIPDDHQCRCNQTMLKMPVISV